VSRQADRRRAWVRLAVLGLGIAVAFLAVTLAGIAPSDMRRWLGGAGLVGPVVFVLAAGALSLALFRARGRTAAWRELRGAQSRVRRRSQASTEPCRAASRGAPRRGAG
jgi:hypothetical protein